MRHRTSVLSGGWLSSGLLISLLACGGDGGAGPNPGGAARDAAARLDRLADSVADGGYSPSAEALRHAAEIVRLTGHATPVTLTIDGTPRRFLAVAEQLDFPYLECRWPTDSGVVSPGDSGSAPPPDSVVAPPADTAIAPPSDTLTAHPDTISAGGDCTVVGTSSMRTLIAWEPEHLAEVVRIVSDAGNTTVEPKVPDVMTSLPQPVTAGGGTLPPAPGDSSDGRRLPGFMGEYLVRDVGSWWAVEGTQANALEQEAGSCTSERASFDYVEFECAAARFRFEFDMRVEPVRYQPLMDSSSTAPQGDHRLALGSTPVDGVRLTAVAWTPRPLPPSGLPPAPGPPVPVDSTGALPVHP
jgi:hypothetical protein